MLIYLGFSALAVFVANLALQVFGEPSLLVVTHLIFTVAIVPLIFGAITHFVPVLTRSGGAHRSLLLVPVLLQATGVLVFIHFYGLAGVTVLHVAAGIALVVSVGFSGWLIRRARRTLGKPHPGWRWYLAAVVCLAIGVALVPVMDFWPAQRQSLRLLHLHLNTLGFIGLTAIGTLQVLMPTALSGPDAEATIRLRRDLPLAFGGILVVAFGAAFWWPLSLCGAAILIYVVGRLGLAWLGRYGLRRILDHGAAVALAGALFGFVLVLVFGITHGLGWMSGHDAVSAFVVAFLLPLVTGALSQLLPVWCQPGRRTERRDRLHAQLAVGGGIRTLLFVGAGISLGFGQVAGLWLAVGGLLQFIAVLVRAVVFPAST